MDVLPTDWSPRNTSLYLASGASDVPPFLDDEDVTDADSDWAVLILFVTSNLDIRGFLLLVFVFVLMFTNCSFSEVFVFID